MNLRYLILLAGAVAAAWSFRNWRQAVKVAMVLLVLEGALRKWFFLESQDLIYFAKDVVFLGAYLGFLAARPQPHPPALSSPQLNALLLFASGFGLVQVFNPSLPNLLVGLLGFKSYFLYVPLIYVLPAAFSSDRDLARFLYRYLLLAVPVGLLGLAQFFSPQGSALNVYARPTSDVTQITTFGSSPFVRITSTFSYISGYSVYNSAAALLLLAVLTTVGWNFRRLRLLYLALGLTVLGMFMTGSRGPVFSLALLLPLFAWLTLAKEQGGSRVLGRLFFTLALTAGFIGVTAPEAAEAFYQRTTAASDTRARIYSPFTAPLRVAGDAGVLGIGIGATHQAASTLVHDRAPYSWVPGVPLEGETGRIMMELGPIGFLLIYLGRVYLVVLAARCVRSLRTRFHRSLAVAGLLFMLSQLPGSIVFNVTTDVFFWFFGALVFTVARLDRQEPIRHATPKPAVPALLAHPGLAALSGPQLRRGDGPLGPNAG